MFKLLYVAGRLERFRHVLCYSANELLELQFPIESCNVHEVISPLIFLLHCSRPEFKLILHLASVKAEKRRNYSYLLLCMPLNQLVIVSTQFDIAWTKMRFVTRWAN
jgi:hypothetical protein